MKYADHMSSRCSTKSKMQTVQSWLIGLSLMSAKHSIGMQPGTTNSTCQLFGEWRGSSPKSAPGRAYYLTTKSALSGRHSGRSEPTVLFVKMLLLTAQRHGEVARMSYKEVGVDGIWTIPAERYKTKRPNFVPLSKAALAIIKAQQKFDNCDYVFPRGPKRRTRAPARAKPN